MKFTIVITTYNRLSLLRRSIASALAQSVPCEVVVADDCSSDGTEAYLCNLREELRAKGDDRLVYHRNSHNMGHAATINAGVQAATGDWIKPVDDDDYLADNCIEEIIKAIALRPQAVICSCQAAQVDVNQNELSRTRKAGPGKVFYIPQEDIHYGMLLEQIPFGTPIQVAFTRDAFLKSGGWDSRLDVNFDDIDSWVKIAQFGDAIFINQCLAYRTVWPGSYNKKFSRQKRLDTHIELKEKIYSLVDEKHRQNIPSIRAFRNYLRLHWALVAAKQRSITDVLSLALPAVFYLPAWKLLFIAIITRYNQQFLLQKQLDKNIWVWTKLSILVGENRFYNYADFYKIRHYLRLRHSLIAFKQGKFSIAITLAFPSVFSVAAWKLLIKSIISEHHLQKDALIRKFVLVY
ncbi:glycosyltransferase family 2 protein [Floridanema aerugineum]|jgi:glycosyltransferase involved in cell wall biosynthesis|uniref:Glycosyltransferase family 2 protein n=1 Tax=Floridaenema aerugineum BLCC-F46 TaxID=3153654 RepID=A0ABV4XEC3_9CYAN